MYPRVSRIRFALALSLAVHLVLLWPWAPWMRDSLQRLPPDRDRKEDGGDRLVVRIAPREMPDVPLPSQRIRAKPAPRTPEPLRARQDTPPATPSPVLTHEASKPVAPSPNEVANAPSPEPPRANTPSAPPALDMASLLEARRRARGETAPITLANNDEDARKNRIVAENLGNQRGPAFGADPRSGGGIFQIETLYMDSAEFLFFGWNRDIRRNIRQKIEVRRGANPDIRIAVVRKMIDIIRDHEQGDFRWDSSRLRRSLTLSARPRDQAELEDFLMAEFFSLEAR